MAGKAALTSSIPTDQNGNKQTASQMGKSNAKVVVAKSMGLRFEVLEDEMETSTGSEEKDEEAKQKAGSKEDINMAASVHDGKVRKLKP